MNLHGGLKYAILALVLPLAGNAQPDKIKRNVDAYLVFDGKEMGNQHDSMSKQELIRAFEENKVTVGRTSMRVVSFTISYMRVKGCQALFGPYHIYASDVTNGANAADTVVAHRRMAKFIKSKLHNASNADKVFIEDICARTASGDLCHVKSSIFVLK